MKYLYRSEEPYGSWHRDIIEVLSYEIHILGNIGILDEIQSRYNLSTDDIPTLVSQINSNLKYCIWLAEYNIVANYYDAPKDTIECYPTSEYLLCDLGNDGKLYGYKEMPLSSKVV